MFIYCHAELTLLSKVAMGNWGCRSAIHPQDRIYRHLEEDKLLVEYSGPVYGGG
jgi:hypothetical protein